MATAISETIRILSRIPVSASIGHHAVASVTGQRDQMPAPPPSPADPRPGPAPSDRNVNLRAL
jgi:hypothetical protein